MACHFSRRTSWPTGENRLSRAVEERRAGGLEVLDLTESNPTRAGFRYPLEIFSAPLSDPNGLLYSPLPQGLLTARDAVSDDYKHRGCSVPPENIFLTASTSEAYTFLFRLLCDPGDKVLVPAPSYPLFSYLADINDVVTDHYALRFERDSGQWWINLESVEHAIDERTRAVILVSPNNPTGSCVKRGELASLNALCAAHGISIISDEVFSEYLFPGCGNDPVSLAGNDAVLSFALGGISKTLALPQMKLAWFAANGPKDILAGALARLEILADTYLSVNTPVQTALPLWFQKGGVVRDQIRERVQGNYQVLKRMAPSGVEVLPVEGGWSAVVRFSGVRIDEAWAVALLERTGVLVHPGFFFDFPTEDFLVLSLLPLPDVFSLGLGRILEK